jgi:hypothetical protein
LISNGVDFSVSVRPRNAESAHLQAVDAQQDPLQASVQSSAPTSNENVQAHSFKMNRKISTIPDLFEEYYNGCNGKPSVSEMDQNHGSSWRTTDADRQFYSRRMRIISGVLGYSTLKKVSLEDAVRTLESRRLALGKSLDWLGRTYERFSLFLKDCM